MKGEMVCDNEDLSNVGPLFVSVNILIKEQCRQGSVASTVPKLSALCAINRDVLVFFF